MTFSGDQAPAGREAKLRIMRTEWLGLEKFTVMRLMNSQAAVFDAARDSWQVLVKQDLLMGFLDRVRSAGVPVEVVFEPVKIQVADAETMNALLAARGLPPSPRPQSPA